MKKKKLKAAVLVLTLFILGLGLAPPVCADSFTFTADQVIQTMTLAGAPLSNPTYLYGLWEVRVIPEVTGGGFTVTGASTNQTGWVAAGLAIYRPKPYGTNCAEFYAAPNNPLYEIIDQPASYFPAVDNILAVNGSSTFTVNFDLAAGATWTGKMDFLVDGSKYYAAGGIPATWVEDFYGDYTAVNELTGLSELGGGLALNVNGSYQCQPQATPLPGTLLLLGSGLVGLGLIGRRKIATL